MTRTSEMRHEQQQEQSKQGKKLLSKKQLFYELLRAYDSTRCYALGYPLCQLLV